MSEQPMVPVSQLSNLFGVTERRVQQLAEDGHIPRPDRNQYPLWPSIQGYIKFLQDRVTGRKTSSDEQAERIRLTKAKADITELEAAERQGDLLRAEAIHKQDALLAHTLKNNLLSMPDRIAALCAAETDAGEVHDLITTEVVHSLELVLENLADLQVDDASIDITRSIAHEYLDEPSDDQHANAD